MPDPFATATDIAAYWRPLGDVEQSTASALLGAASAVIRKRVPPVDDSIAAGALDAATVRYICSVMVIRVMRNPDNVLKMDAGSFSVTKIPETIGLDLTPREYALLSGSTGALTVGTVKMTPFAAFVPREFWADADDGLTPEQVTALATAPESTVRFRQDDWPGLDWDAAQAAWRQAQSDYAAGAGVELTPEMWSTEWRRRQAEVLAGIADSLLTFTVSDWPDATDARDAWEQWGAARSALYAEYDWITGWSLVDERARRIQATT